MCCGSESCADRLLPWPILAGEAEGPGLELELEVEPELPAFAAKDGQSKSRSKEQYSLQTQQLLLRVMLSPRPITSGKMLQSGASHIRKKI